MSYPINYPTPQGANVQIFRGGYESETAKSSSQDWVKPQGASFVWFTLIGAGGGGENSTLGGGSGAVTNFMCPAFLIPDILRITPGIPGFRVMTNGTASTVVYQQKDGTGYELLNASGGSTGAGGGSAMAANAFTAMGFFQSISGQAGSSTNITASTTTFLSGGTGSNLVTGNYGYTTGTTGRSMFQMQPIIVGVGGQTTENGSTKYAATGCGGGVLQSGGPGMVVIITW